VKFRVSSGAANVIIWTYCAGRSKTPVPIYVDRTALRVGDLGNACQSEEKGLLELHFEYVCSIQI
jgi:hypothetical protein